ncbi:MAG TPA: hypothetical protein VNM37_29545 [Candidatus Dormibacteraeota bacterium]|nr:hypothetical protein [Candidatus Dormibacteraeota bacterium]
MTMDERRLLWEIAYGLELLARQVQQHARWGHPQAVEDMASVADTVAQNMQVIQRVLVTDEAQHERTHDR